MNFYTPITDEELEEEYRALRKFYSNMSEGTDADWYDRLVFELKAARDKLKELGG